jgi:addiction module HigA family antidote
MALIAIHPGEHLAEELQELGISPTELARQLDVPANRVTQILKGSRAITADTALRLGHYFGVSPRFWLNLQSIYDLRLAEQSTGRSVHSLPSLRQSIPA